MILLDQRLNYYSLNNKICTALYPFIALVDRIIIKMLVKMSNYDSVRSKVELLEVWTIWLQRYLII